MSGGHWHASPQLLASSQSSHQSLQELVAWSHVPGQTLPSAAGSHLATELMPLLGPDLCLQSLLTDTPYAKAGNLVASAAKGQDAIAYESQGLPVGCKHGCQYFAHLELCCEEHTHFNLLSVHVRCIVETSVLSKQASLLLNQQHC